MFTFPDTEKKLKSTISRYKSIMRKEKKEFGNIHDGYGKRYLLFCLYFVLGDLKKSNEYFEWYKEEFPDDIGEPIQKLCWVLSLHRMGKDAEARRMLADTMLSNLYIIPQIVEEEIQKYDMQHFSNLEFIDYITYMPDEVWENISQDEIEWMKSLYDSSEFRRIRQRCIEIRRELKDAKGIEKRRPLVEEENSLLDTLTD